MTTYSAVFQVGCAVVELVACGTFFWKSTGAVFRAANSHSTGENKKGGLKIALFKRPSARVTWLCALFLLGYVGVEVALGGWIVTYMIRVRHGAPFASGMTATGFWLGITVGRVTLGFVTPRVGEKIAIAVRPFRSNLKTKLTAISVGLYCVVYGVQSSPLARASILCVCRGCLPAGLLPGPSLPGRNRDDHEASPATPPRQFDWIHRRIWRQRSSHPALRRGSVGTSQRSQRVAAIHHRSIGSHLPRVAGITAGIESATE